MKPAARLIYGPANSGKTERCIAAYLDCLCARRNEKAMFLCPTALKVAEVKARIVASGRIAGIRDPRILEFYGLAQRVIASAAQKAREISPLVKTLIIQDVVSKQLKAGRLRYFQPISEFQGFFEMVGDFIGELKAAAVTPEEFAEAIGRRAGRRGSQRDAEISGIYTDYQERLRREDLYDREGRLWLARDLLRGKEESFVGEKMDLLLVDGFASFSPAELQIVSELAKRSGETVITLTFVKNEGSGRHYRAVERTHALLHGSFDLMEEPTASAVKSFPLPFQEVADNLFADLIPSSSVQAHPHVEMIAAPGQLREIEEVAREIKKLLIPPQTLPWLGRVIVPDDILVILRSLAEYGDRVEEVFQQFGIPVLVHRTRRLCESPLVKTLLSALEAVAGDGERDAVLGFLKSSYVRTSALKDGAEPDQIATAALRAGVIAGLNEWPERIRRYRNRLEAQSSSGSLPEGENQPEGIAEKEDLQRLEQAARTVSAILADLRTIPAHGTPAQFLKAIASLVERFAMEDAIWLGAPEEAKRDVAALGQLRRELADALRLLGDRKTPLQEFCKLFREICQSPLSFSPEAREGKVQVMDAHESRQLHFPIVFVAGLAEKEFPRYQSEDALYDDESRRQLKNQGISLPPRALRAADEMLLFYSAVTRATQKLYLAYPLTDNEGKEKLRSYFVDELLSLFKGKISERRASVCEAAPSLEAVFRPRDLFGSMAYSLYQKESEASKDSPVLYNHLLTSRTAELTRLLTAVSVENERESKDPFTRYDGVLDDRAILDELAAERRKRVVFSTSRFNEYGLCPFRYFCDYLLELEPLEEPEEAMGAQELGSLYHNILHDFYAGIRKDRNGATELVKYSEADLLGRMTKAAQDEFAQAVKDGRARNDALWRLQQDMILRRLKSFLQNEMKQSQKAEGQQRPAYFEVAFGGARGRDPASQQKPLVIDDPSGPIQVRGTIDRVDVVDEGKGLTIIDYKSGRFAPARRDMEEGLNFQLPVYIMAAEKVLFPRLTPIAAFFYRIRDCQRKTIIHCTDQEAGDVSEDWEELKSLVVSYMRQYVADIAAGKFPVAPRGDCQTPTCAYCTICRYSESRQERKQKQAGDKR